MVTLAEMQVSIAARLIDTSNTAVPLESVTSAINTAVDFWKLRRFWFNTAEDIGVLTLQDPVITLPSDFLSEIPDLAPFVIDYSSMHYVLDKKLPWQFQNVYLDNGYGLPQIYARIANEYRCYPIPDQAYTLITRYQKDYVPLVLDADSNDFTIYADQLIMYEALGRLMGELRQDEKMETYYRAAAEREYINLGNRTRKMNASGFVALHSIL
jgi:hypothetical protein